VRARVTSRYTLCCCSEFTSSNTEPFGSDDDDDPVESCFSFSIPSLHNGFFRYMIWICWIGLVMIHGWIWIGGIENAMRSWSVFWEVGFGISSLTLPVSVQRWSSLTSFAFQNKKPYSLRTYL
jgi:hypothetical protein